MKKWCFVLGAVLCFAGSRALAGELPHVDLETAKAEIAASDGVVFVDVYADW